MLSLALCSDVIAAISTQRCYRWHYSAMLSLVFACSDAIAGATERCYRCYPHAAMLSLAHCALVCGDTCVVQFLPFAQIVHFCFILFLDSIFHIPSCAWKPLSEMPPKRKRAKLDCSFLIGLKNISIDNIRKVVKALPEELHHHCRNLKKNVEVATAEIYDDDVRLVLPLPLVDGTMYMWHLARPQAVLRKLSKTSPALQRVLSNAKDSHSKPWRIVHYHDEVTAGQLLAPVHSRSFTTFRYSFADVGRHLLCAQEMWIEYGILRTHVLEKVDGGMGCVMKHLMHAFFTSDESFTTAGVDVDIGEGSILLFAENSNIVADEKALKYTWDFKGASGLLPCIDCANVTMKHCLDGDAIPLDNSDGTLVEISCPDVTKFVANTDADLYHNYAEMCRLKGRIPNYKFELMEIVCGLNYNPRGIMADERLRNICPPLSCKTEDWAHIYLCKGVGGDCVHGFLRRIKDNVENETLREELRKWSWPRRLEHQNVHMILSDKRLEACKDGWKSSAGEFLLVVPVLAHWAEEHLMGMFPSEVESLIQFISIIDLIMAIKIGASDDLDELGRRQKLHFETHVRLYGADGIKPKWHKSLHLVKQFRRDCLIVYDSLSNERQHQVAKAIGNMVDNIQSFEKTVLCRSLAHQITALKEFNECPCLLGKPMWKEELNAWVSNRIRVDGLHVGVGDIVATRDREVVEVKVCGQSGNHIFLLADACDVVAHRQMGVEVRRKLSLRLLWITNNLVVSCAKCWKELGDGKLHVIFPIH